ncbi:Alpha-amylase/subtilisin inhibitor [Morus notabilis]|uniref:Alpha-amylase/subtilisin inhibitor n=1 Tax=Morus notabilis TaxID=981085 RepID=W9RV98_9ROSA|nr:kunitz trypsin inhibitor 2 [Morus notabilis]EXB74706.1 Alpha-amylase/subtilisin inhibitor [Morus notabilis]
MASRGMAATADDVAVLDTSGQPLLRGVEYYIKPAVTGDGGNFTLVDRNGSCPFYVGQENATSTGGIPVTFSPYMEEESVVRELRNFKVEFSGNTTCNQSTVWKVGEVDLVTETRLIGTGDNASFLNYFSVDKGEEEPLVNGSYGLRWCPTQLCPYCRFACAYVDVLVENGTRLLSLNETAAFPVVFERATI